MALDLSKTNLSDMSEAGFEFELTMPEIGTPMDAFVTVRGSKSKTVQNHARKAHREETNRRKRLEQRGRDADPSLEELEEMVLESAVVRIIDWRGIEEDGKAVKFTPDAARRILGEHTWIRDQIIEESDNLGNFTKKT